MTPQIINLGRRFGLAAPDITKGRKKPSGMDWRAYNAANPTETQKDSRGRWKSAGAMVSELMEVIRRHHGDGPNPFAAKLSEQVERTAHEAGLRSSTRRGDLVRFDPAAHVISGRKPKPGTMVEVEAPGFDVPLWRVEDLDGPETGKLGLVNVVPARVRRSTSAAEQDYDAKKPRATVRVTGKPDLDYEHMATTMRGLPVLPESEGAARLALEPLTIPQLKELARTAEVPVGSKARKQDIRDAIVQQLVGTRLTTDAVMNYGDPGRFDRRRAEAAANAKPTSVQIAAAFDEISAGRNGDPWVDLASLRGKLGGTKAEQDAALMGMLDEGKGMRLIPEENQQTLTGADRAAAIRVSGEDKHLIGFPERSPSPAPAAKVTAKPRTRTPRANPARPEALSGGRAELKDWAASISNTLDGMTSVPEGKAFLGGFSKTQLQDLAGEVGIPAARSKTKAQLIDSITFMKIQGPGALRRAMAGDGATDRLTSVPDRSASLRNTEAQLDEMRSDLVAQYGEDPDRWPEARNDRQVEQYWDQRDRVARIRRQSEGKA